VLTDKQINGINLEKKVAWTLEHKFKVKVDHNNFDDSYPLDNHNVVDIVTETALIECTNLKPTTFLNDEDVKKKLDYFPRRDPTHLFAWFLICTFANFSNSIKQLMQKLGIILIELDVHADKNNLFEIVKRLFHTRLYSFLVKQKPRPTKFLANTSQSILYPSSNPVPVADYSTQSTTLTTNTNHLHQHQLLIEEEYRTYYEDMKEYSIWSVQHPYHDRIMAKLI
jgi:hypothetical protein